MNSTDPPSTKTFTEQLKVLGMEMICFLLAIKQWPSDVSFREDFMRYFLLLAYIAILLYALQFLHSTLNKWTDASISVNEGDLVETFVDDPGDLGDPGDPGDPGEWKPPEWKSQSVIYDPDFPQDTGTVGENAGNENKNENEQDIPEQDMGEIPGDMGGMTGMMGGGAADAPSDSEPATASSMFPLWFLVRPFVDFFQIKGEALLSQKTYLQLLVVLIVVFGTTFLFVYFLSVAGQYGYFSLWIWLGIAFLLYGVYLLMRFILSALSKSDTTVQSMPHRQNLSILATCIVIIHGIGKHISRIAHAQLPNMEQYMKDTYKWNNIDHEIALVNKLREQYTSTLLGTEESLKSLDQWTWIDWYRIAEVYLFKFGRIRLKKDQDGKMQPDWDPNPLISWIPSFLVSDTFKSGQTATRFVVMKQRKKIMWAAILLALLLNLLFSKMSFPEFFITNKMLFATGGILTMLNKYRFPASSIA